MNFFITGLVAFAAMILTVTDTHAAGICNPNTIDTHYMAIYCGIRINDNEEADTAIVKTLASQFDMKEDIIKEILAGTICETIKDYSADEKAKLPQAVQNACLSSGKSTEQVLGGWSVFTDIRNTYEKENVIQRSSASLKFKFKASEQYWDGKIGPGSDAPFDLIVDLNLIEIVLFGSKAQWMQDIYTFPRDEGEDSNTGETPNLDQALPPEGSAGEEKPTTPQGTEPGLTVTGGEETPGTSPPDCVTPDSPDADNGDSPGSSYENPLCGNGTVDILVAEQCDDGNKQSGDGCNQYCKTETNGSSDQCIDPEAITFKTPTGTGGTQNTGNIGATAESTGAGNAGATPANPAECPPGTVPRISSVSITGPRGKGGGGQNQTVLQSPEYPGPSLGGTLKQYPESNPPVCGPGETKVAENDDGTPVCWQTEFCANPDKVRDFFFGRNWRDNPATKAKADAIEALFCVNVTKANRPKSPYQMIEGCIDCHISAMVDALEKALQTNVSPLVNTTAAFSISSKFGPTFSFNLNTAVKGIPKYQPSKTASTAIKKADESTAKSIKDHTPPELTIQRPEDSATAVARTTNRIEETRAKIQEDTRMYGMSNQVISDQEVGGRITPLLIQMRDSFINIQDKFEGMVGTSTLDQKEQCKP